MTFWDRAPGQGPPSDAEGARAGDVANVPPAPSLTEFLLARIGEDETALTEELRLYCDDDAHWDDRRVLAECEAKRRIVDEYVAVPEQMQQPYRAGLGRALRCLALPYASHPDFNPAWSL